MEERKSLGRGLEEISGQFLSTPGEEHQLKHLIDRVEKLEDRLVAKLSPDAAVYETETGGEILQFSEYKKALTDLHAQLGQDYIASGVIGSNGLPLVFDSVTQGFNQLAASAYLTESINDAGEIMDKLSLGAIESLIITSHQCHILLQCLPEESYFLCLLMKKNGNIGLAKLMLEKFSPRLKAY